MNSYIAFGASPDAPAAPTRVSSTKTSITVTWTAPSSNLQITGYILNMDDGVNKDLQAVYYGMNRPNVLEYKVENLTTGLPYSFSVQAIN